MYHMVHRISVTARSAAPPDAIYALLKDPATWPSWSPMDAAELDAPGEDEPYGVGSVRALTRGRVRGRDEVVELIPDKRFSYRHVSGLPVRDYHADVDLAPLARGTQISWRSSFRPKYVGTGWFWRLALRRMLQQMASGLSEYAASEKVSARPN
jgi:Polyketide cyclase / dehydrase and lipid transport